MAKKVNKLNKVDLIIETNKTEVEYHKDGTNHDLKYDGQNLDVYISKDETGTKVDIQSKSNLLKVIAKIASKLLLNRFKKSK